MKKSNILNILGVILVGILSAGTAFAVTVLQTQNTDTIGTFRTNVNTSLVNLNNGIASSTVSAGNKIIIVGTNPTVVNFVSSTANGDLLIGSGVLGQWNIGQMSFLAPGTLTVGSGTIILSIATATASQNGFLLSSDYQIFSNKASSTLINQAVNTTSSPTFSGLTVNGVVSSTELRTPSSTITTLTVTTCTGCSSGATPAGTSTNVQYNFNGALAGSSTVQIVSSTPSLVGPTLAVGKATGTVAIGLGFSVVSSTSATSTNFVYSSGTIQSWSVPANVSSIKIEARGAGGAGSLAGAGGAASGTLAVTAGTTYYICVGASTSTLCGGGDSTASSTKGGGATWFSTQNSFNSSTVILVAAGGGGQGQAGGVETGGNGGGTSGVAGANDGAGGGGGGTQTAGGAGGSGTQVSGNAGTEGQGGNAVQSGGGNWSGAGGGGFFGGGSGGAQTGIAAGGGGGGSSFTKSTLTATSTTSGGGGAVGVSGSLLITYVTSTASVAYVPDSVTFPGCLELGNSNGANVVNYITALGGVLTTTTTKPVNCQ